MQAPLVLHRFVVFPHVLVVGNSLDDRSIFVQHLKAGIKKNILYDYGIKSITDMV